MTYAEYFKSLTTSYFESGIDALGGLRDALSGNILYFEKEYNPEINTYISSNYECLKEEFERVNMTFIYLPLIKKSITNHFPIKEIIGYFLPSITSEIVADLEGSLLGSFNSDESIKHLDYTSLIESFGYKGNVNRGFLYVVADKVVTFEVPDHVSDYESFFKNFLKYLKEHSFEDVIDDMIGSSIIDLNEHLDEEALAIVDEMQAKLSTIKDSGQLLFLVPILKDMLDKQAKELKFGKVSKMVIDEDWRIILPLFQKEVVMSHLTKAVYLMFLNHPKGINLKDLHLYRTELLVIYLHVSNQRDLDKMSRSVNDIVNLETKAIYSHLSRIKSAFYKIMDDSYAKQFIVSGVRDEDRRVCFDTNSIKWKHYINNIVDDSNYIGQIWECFDD